MKLLESDKKMLLSWGFEEKYLPQIEEAMQKSKTKYRYEGKAISRERAIELLGMEAYLSGLSRSAFHFTATRAVDAGGYVHFDSSPLFGKVAW